MADSSPRSIGVLDTVRIQVCCSIRTKSSCAHLVVFVSSLTQLWARDVLNRACSSVSRRFLVCVCREWVVNAGLISISCGYQHSGADRQPRTKRQFQPGSCQGLFRTVTNDRTLYIIHPDLLSRSLIPQPLQACQNPLQASW